MPCRWVAEKVRSQAFHSLFVSRAAQVPVTKRRRGLIATPRSLAARPGLAWSLLVARNAAVSLAIRSESGWSAPLLVHRGCPSGYRWDRGFRPADHERCGVWRRARSARRFWRSLSASRVGSHRSAPSSRLRPLPNIALELTGRRLAGMRAAPAGRPPGSGPLRRASAGRSLVHLRAAGSSMPSRWVAGKIRSQAFHSLFVSRAARVAVTKRRRALTATPGSLAARPGLAWSLLVAGNEAVSLALRS
jgi:hypothetical protein